MPKPLSWLELFVKRGVSEMALSAGIEAVLTQAPSELVDTLWGQSFVTPDDAAVLLGYLTCKSPRDDHPLLNQDDLTVREFLLIAFDLAVQHLDSVDVDYLAGKITVLLVARGRYLLAGHWCRISGFNPTVLQLCDLAKQLVYMGQERATKVITDYLGLVDDSVRHQFPKAFDEALAESLR